ncbi:hypothetical protein IKO18_02520 [bacterium]|nr:hypothetical protein [bacterium]
MLFLEILVFDAFSPCIAAAADPSITIFQFKVPLSRLNEKPSLGSFQLAETSTFPLIVEFHFTVTATLGYDEYLHTSKANHPAGFAFMVVSSITIFQLLFDNV